MNPYHDRPDASFWRRSVSRVPVHQIDPADVPAFCLTGEDKIATAGSCFAQHVARRLPGMGLSYLCLEDDPSLPLEERQRRQFGLFSGRYGNIYTVRQLLELIEEAFGERAPATLAWQNDAGGWVDALRPSVEPAGLPTAEQVQEARLAHLDAVRRLVGSLDVLVFTLGLTEAWRDRREDRVLPLAPGVIAGSYDPAACEFVNFDVAQTAQDLARAIELIRRVNPPARFILTVSPVPLIATFEDRSVITSTCYSKSVLRVAAEMTCKQFDGVDYFPSYEIITSPATAGVYFDEDRREVRPEGVAHVMRAFRSRYLPADDGFIPAPLAEAASMICDEESIEVARGSAAR